MSHDHEPRTDVVGLSAPGGRAILRAGDDDRKRVVDWLQAHYVAGRLTQVNDRTAAASGADPDTAPCVTRTYGFDANDNRLNKATAPAAADGAGNLALAGQRRAPDQGGIDPLYGTRGELLDQRMMGRVGLSSDHQAAGVLVEAVDDARPLHTTDTFQ